MSVTSNHPHISSPREASGRPRGGGEGGGSRRRRKAETRGRLVAGARACFEERGFAGTHVGHISRSAGVAHGTFYVHFASKAEVLDAVLAELNRALAARLTTALAAPGDVTAKVGRAAEAFLGHCAEHRGLIECYAQRIGTGTDLDTLRDGINPDARAVLRAALPASIGGGRDLVMHGLLAMWLRVALQHLFAPDAPSRARTVRTLTAMTVGALAAVTPPGSSDPEGLPGPGDRHRPEGSPTSDDGAVR